MPKICIKNYILPQASGRARTQLDLVGAIQEETLQEALNTLKRHDVIHEKEGRWQIIVELFRRWVLQRL